MGDGVLGITRSKDNPGFGVAFFPAVHQFSAAHLRHHDISEQQVDGTGMLLPYGQGRLAGVRLQDGIAVTLQDPAGHAAHQILVLDHQDGFLALPGA